MTRPFGPYWDPYMGGWWWIGALIQLVFWAILIVAIIYFGRLALTRWLPPSQGGARSRALEELDLRYARGEINRTEYFERRADLTGGTPAPPPAPKP